MAHSKVPCLRNVPFTRCWILEGTFGLDAYKNGTRKYGWKVTQKFLGYFSPWAEQCQLLCLYFLHLVVLSLHLQASVRCPAPRLGPPTLQTTRTSLQVAPGDFCYKVIASANPTEKTKKFDA